LAADGGRIHRNRLRLWSSQQHPAPAPTILPPSRQETTDAPYVIATSMACILIAACAAIVNVIV
jgi:hypothetical protein